MRDLAFPLIEPPYDRMRWDAVLYEYGMKREFQRELWVVDPTAYYRHLLAANYRSTAGRYNQLIDDIRNDVVRIGPFFDMAHRVVELDRKRQASMDLLPDIAPADRVNALARVGENKLTIAWVQTSLAQRCAGYRFALDHLVVCRAGSSRTPSRTSRSSNCSSRSRRTSSFRRRNLLRRRSPSRRNRRWPSGKSRFKEISIASAAARCGIARRPARAAPSA